MANTPWYLLYLNALCTQANYKYDQLLGDHLIISTGVFRQLSPLQSSWDLIKSMDNTLQQKTQSKTNYAPFLPAPHQVRTITTIHHTQQECDRQQPRLNPPTARQSLCPWNTAFYSDSQSWQWQGQPHTELMNHSLSPQTHDKYTTSSTGAIADFNLPASPRNLEGTPVRWCWFALPYRGYWMYEHQPPVATRLAGHHLPWFCALGCFPLQSLHGPIFLRRRLDLHHGTCAAYNHRHVKHQPRLDDIAQQSAGKLPLQLSTKHKPKKPRSLLIGAMVRRKVSRFCQRGLQDGDKVPAFFLHLASVFCTSRTTPPE